MRPIMGVRILVLTAVTAATLAMSIGVAAAHVTITPSSLPTSGQAERS